MIRKSITRRFSIQRSFWANGTMSSALVTNNFMDVRDYSEVQKSNSPPGYKELIKANRQAGSTLSGFTRSLSQLRYLILAERYLDLNNGDFRREVELNWLDGGFALDDPFNQPNYLNNLSVGDANAGALTGLVKQIRNAQTAFQGGVFIGELGEAVKMLRSPAEGLRRGIDGYLTSLKKVKRIPNISQRRSALADTWLEYSFGWTPFLSDIDDAKKVIEEVHHKDSYEKLFSEASTSTSSNATFASIGVGLGSVVVKGDIVYETKVKYYGTCASWNANQLSNMSLGLDLSNFIPTAWELIPYSFMVDYFTNIGEIISAATLNTSGLRWLMQGVEKTASLTTREIIFVPAAPTVWKVVRESILQRPRGQLRSIYRTPYYGSLVPNIRFEVPGMGLKWLNLAALGRNHRALLPFF